MCLFIRLRIDTAPSAVNVLLRTCPTRLCPRPTTLIASFPWPCGWWWRMGWPINQPVGIYGEIIAFLFPSPPSKTGWRAGGKKAASHMEGSYLDWALADFSGYIAADELYDGPFCVLFVVDNRTFKRLLYQVLDHDPGHKDIEAFLRRFEKALRQRGLVLQGVTTDGSPLTGDGDLAYLTVVSGQFHGLVNVPEALMTTLY